MNPVRILGYCFFRRRLEVTGPAATFARLCTSRHLEDLQWIASVVGTIFILLICVVLPLDLHYSKQFSADSLILKSAGGVVAVTAAVLNWIYQSGSRRIGVVDLFACEISAICRVCLVVDFALASVLVAESPDAPHTFTSSEHYTPVYDRQLGDLQALDVDVVTQVTEFYTYRITMMDYLRAIAAAEDPAVRRHLRSLMIYMQYLMYESARHAVDSLIEFEPNLAESKLNILCSEMVTYQFLRYKYDANDFRGKRLLLRSAEYHLVVGDLYGKIMANQKLANWKRAQTTAPELLARYRVMCTAIGEAPVL